MMSIGERSGLRWTAFLLWLLLASSVNGFSSLTTAKRRHRHATGLSSYSGSSNGSSDDRVPFIIEKLTTRTTLFTFQEISEMCIDVFFNDHGPKTTPWKQLQLAYQLPYLRNIQRAVCMSYVGEYASIASFRFVYFLTHVSPTIKGPLYAQIGSKACQ
jgi:hypothetical protein